MRRVHLLADRFSTQNSAAILAPLVRFQRALREHGCQTRLFFDETPEVAEADLVIVLDRYLAAAAQSEGLAAAITRLRHKIGAFAFFDTGDSSGLLQADVLPLVRAYLKPFLLRERSQYLARHYGGRLFTDHYHRRHGVNDDRPLWSDPVAAPDLLSRLHVGWSPAVYRYDYFANRAAKLYRYVPFRPLLHWPARYRLPSAPRSIGVSCRISLGHQRESVVFQRRLLKQAVGAQIDTGFVRRRAYYRELRQARAVLSPFGWGEFAIRDYEAFTSGAALLKPDMSHLETWPALYEENVTYFTIDWDLTSLSDVLANVRARPDQCTAVAIAGQRRFRDAADGAEAFACHFRQLVDCVLASEPDRAEVAATA